ncbi:hypothetical protein KTH73_07270 [Acinetobacter courvalinii]|jgi:hypothetical protein|uniref:Uncharacterized protein n=1 Tax=Acinetobacter courvalinii TaxID=280147 RepID=N9R8Y0_9GAMM|nr:MULTISPECIES: hypothetical protein [Acinetobacter]EXB28056.1 hypothetical protein J537_0289 [Acinetobacter baumannii 1437282]EXB49169.1 hypothetical protein J522_0748 [Acinetobacter baumannii 146457]RSN83102.1 hypothetical protein EA770_05765 [Acinetobacter baumannii]EKU52622.1 hypothetical protein ACINWC323_2246 [Acinetobacter sp. WC-323]ENX05109.1 hypothetical protein F898_02049 [Acinetobacter courvalinii]
MKFSKSNLILSTMMSAAALFATATHAADNPLQTAYKSTNVKAALVNVCKDQTAKGGKLTAAEVSKFCGCQIDAQGKVTEAQKWEIQSAINAKKSPSSLGFVQQQNKDLQACLGAPLVSKLEKLTEEAMKAAQQQQQAPKK